MIDLRAYCVLHLKCNEDAANTFILNSRGAPHGTSQRNTNRLHMDGIGGGALDFDNTIPDFITIDIPKSFFQNNFLVNVWINPTNLTTDLDGILGVGDIDGVFILGLDSIGMDAYYMVGGEELAGFATAFSFSGRSMITIVVEQINDTQVKLSGYINGTYKGSSVYNCIMVNYDSDVSLTIGKSPNLSLNDFIYFNGSEDDVMFFNLVDIPYTVQEIINFLWNNGEGIEELVEGDHYRVYRGQDGIFDYENPVAEMAHDDEQVFIGGQDMPADTIWHYIRRRVAIDCGLESQDSPACIVRIDSNGDMLGSIPNAPINLAADGLADGKVKLRWRYAPLDEEIAPTGFHIYIDSGAGFDFETPNETVLYRGGGPKAGEFDWTSESLTNGELYRFCVRSYRTGAGESQNTNSVSIVADSVGPDAITNLIATVEEL